jgi:hypothetical protein
MKHSQLERPPDRLILCDQSDCEEIANCLELHRNREDLVCATHTSSQRHASDLPSRASVVIASACCEEYRELEAQGSQGHESEHPADD